MSSKDVKKGIAIQAKADAEKVEKLFKGLQAHRDILEGLESGQGEIRDTMGIVLDDMSDEEARRLFDLQIKKTPDELDETEKRILCACIYSLTNSHGQNSALQIKFYTNLEKYLGVAERKDNFDFSCLNNVDSHTDRMVILRAVCSFLFLHDQTFAFVKDSESFVWLFAFASVKDIIDVCGAIKSEFSTLGSEGVLGNYDPTLLSQNTFEPQGYITSSEADSYCEDILEPAEEYADLVSFINTAVSDEAAFGKGIAFSESELKKELSKKLSGVAFDSLVAVSKIDRGYLIFTTYALYLKAGSILKSEYVCLPYKDVLASQIITAEGKQPGTRKIIIPVQHADIIKTVEIDDSKLEEEKLRDFLLNIKASGLEFPDSDREVKPDQLPENDKKKLLSIFAFILNQEQRPLTDVYLIARSWKIENFWNTITLEISNDDELDTAITSYLKDIPYPSKRVTATASMKLLMGLISHSNVLSGCPSTQLSVNLESDLRKFDLAGMSSREFNLLMKAAPSIVEESSYEEYANLINSAAIAELNYGRSIKAGATLMIQKIESSIDFKAKKLIKETAKDVADVASTVQSKFAEGVNGVAEKAKKNAAERKKVDDLLKFNISNHKK